MAKKSQECEWGGGSFCSRHLKGAKSGRALAGKLGFRASEEVSEVQLGSELQKLRRRKPHREEGRSRRLLSSLLLQLPGYLALCSSAPLATGAPSQSL